MTAGSPAGKPETIQVTIRGKPETKKTGHRIVRNQRTGKPLLIRRKETVEWTGLAQWQMRQQYKGQPLEGPVLVEYHIYRATDRGDLGGFEAAIDDAIQGQLISNDAQIVGRISRKYIDRVNPRVELIVEAW